MIKGNIIKNFFRTSLRGATKERRSNPLRLRLLSTDCFVVPPGLLAMTVKQGYRRFIHNSSFIILLALLASCGTVPRTTIVIMPDGQPLSGVDDSLYARALESAVSSNGSVSYNRLRNDTDLTEYLRQIALVQVDAFTSRSGLLAFWINAHNAYVLDIIRSNMPVNSAEDISGFRYANVALVGGKLYSLDAIEHTIIEKKFREPRAFFALFDGSRSSPALLNEPYEESHFSDQLDGQCKGFIADSSKNLLDKRSNTLYLSRVFNDYKSPLEDAGGSLGGFVRAFAPPAMAAWIGGHSNLNISYLSYDNTLNTSDIEQHEPIHQTRPSGRRSSGGIR